MFRHSYISLLTSEANWNSLNWKTAFNATEVKLFFDQLEVFQTKYSFSGHRIFNIDEAGISTIHKNSNALASRDFKRDAKAIIVERGVTTIVVCSNDIYVPSKEDIEHTAG